MTILQHLTHWFGVFGPYTVYTYHGIGDDCYEWAHGAFTYRQALTILAEYGAHGGRVTKWGKLVFERKNFHAP